MRLDCRGKLINLNTPKILGILNLTPDSFYDGGKFNVKDKSLKQCEKMLREGATFIDVGAISTRPGASDLNLETEKKRLFPILEALILNFPNSLFSIDISVCTRSSDSATTSFFSFSISSFCSRSSKLSERNSPNNFSTL